MTMMAEATLYEVLGVTRDADTGTIRSAYRAAAKRNHPDAGGTRALWDLVEEAYQCLSDPRRRREYDEFLDRSAGVPPPSAGAAPRQEARTSSPPPPPHAPSRPGADPATGRLENLAEIARTHPSTAGLLLGILLLAAGTVIGGSSGLVVLGLLIAALGALGTLGRFQDVSERVRLTAARSLDTRQLRDLLETVLVGERRFPLLERADDRLVLRGQNGVILVLLCGRLTRRVVRSAADEQRSTQAAKAVLVSTARASASARRAAALGGVELWDSEILGRELATSRALPTPSPGTLLRAELALGVIAVLRVFGRRARRIGRPVR